MGVMICAAPAEFRYYLLDAKTRGTFDGKLVAAAGRFAATRGPDSRQSGSKAESAA